MLGALVALAAALPAPLASLGVDIDGATVAVVVRDGARGPELAVDCVRRCPRRLHYVDPTGDTPLGLFRLGDADGRVFSLWATGSAYRVRAYEIGARGVRKTLDAGTLGAPEFLTAPGGGTIVRTTERDDRDPPSAAPRRVTWTVSRGRFVRR